MLPEAEAEMAEKEDAMEMKQLPMRLAMRVEGNKWNAYVAQLDTMEKAIWIGSIALALVEKNTARKDAFLALMTSSLADAIEELVGRRPTWSEPEQAPEHERTRE